jgi:hypothetical protein
MERERGQKKSVISGSSSTPAVFCIGLSAPVVMGGVRKFSFLGNFLPAHILFVLLPPGYYACLGMQYSGHSSCNVGL